MVALTKGKHENITWHSIISKDRQRSEKICERMLRNFGKYLEKNPGIKGTINVIHFYENEVLIATSK